MGWRRWPVGEHPYARAGLEIRGRRDRSGQYLLQIPLPRSPQPRRPREKWTWIGQVSKMLEGVREALRRRGGIIADDPAELRKLAVETGVPQRSISIFVGYGYLYGIDGRIWVIDLPRERVIYSPPNMRDY